LNSPALILRFPDHFDAAQRDGLVGLLSEYELVAIHEDDLNDSRAWTAHFGSPASRDQALAAVTREPDYAAIDARATEIEDEDWARRTQADLPAIKIGRVVVAPPWDVPPPEPRTPHPDIVVLIEPSRGFGTGHHQSTRLCIALLQNRNVDGLTVADVGTGSGVLAITAAKLGAAFVSAFDSDPDAVENARENIAANGVGTLVEAHVDDLVTTTIRPADLVTANLTGTLLARHAPDLARLLRPGGSLIVSGFNVDEKPRVEEALSANFDLSETAEEDDWHAFVVRAR
jgi:ribosomal protein L11 methyltransferase